MSESGDRRTVVSRRSLLRAGAGTVGLAAAGAAPAAGQETLTYGDWFTDQAEGGEVQNFDGTTVDETGSSSVTVEVGAQGNGGPYAFAPPAVRIDPGTTVTFEWVSDTHNVLVQEQPDGAGWEGHQPIENTGFTYEHTFETEGLYKYYCEPHLPLGMKAAIVVGGAEIAAPSDGGGGGVTWRPPGGDAGMAFMGLLLGTVGLAVVLMAAGDGWAAVRRSRAAAAEAAQGPPTETEPDRGIVHELGHDDFTPFGTATLIVIYFLILVAMWVFVYFVEFLGNGPTVIG